MATPQGCLLQTHLEERPGEEGLGLCSISVTTGDYLALRVVSTSSSPHSFGDTPTMCLSAVLPSWGPAGSSSHLQVNMLLCSLRGTHRTHTTARSFCKKKKALLHSQLARRQELGEKGVQICLCRGC
jgi:hypothetical protein